MRLLSRKTIFVLALTFLFTAMTARSHGGFLIPGEGYMATEHLTTADFDTFSMIDSNTALLYVGTGIDPHIEICDLAGNVQMTLAKPANICDGATRADDFLTGSFIKQDPTTPNTYWVGFAANSGVDGWIYRVTAAQTGGSWTGTWDEIAVLPGNYDMAFIDNSTLLLSANVDGTGTQLLAVDINDPNPSNYTVVANVGGYSAGIGLNAAGDAYYPTYANWGVNEQLLCCTNSDIASAIASETPCTPDVRCTLNVDGTDFGGAGLDVDDAGHVLVAGNPNGQIAIWDETSSTLSSIATAIDGTIWTIDIDTVGDLTEGGGSAYVTAWGGAGILKLTKLIPGDANGDGIVDGSDATTLAAHWQESGASWSDGDFNGDGDVDGSDATLLASHWQESLTTMPPTAVPEPSMVMLLAALALAGLIRRRRPTKGG